MIGLVIVVFLAGFGLLIWYDSNQQAGPPGDVQEFDMAAGVNKHTQDAVDYEENPPVGGPHNPIWQNEGFYDAPIRSENAVHTMEHGAVWITYSPNLPQSQKDTLRDTVEGRDCLLASPYPDLSNGAPVVASAWGVQLSLDGADDPDLQNFIQSYRRGTQTPEPGAACVGGTAETAS